MPFSLYQYLLISAMLLLTVSGRPAGAQKAVPAGFDPPVLYLTWQRDPTTTMTVCWQTDSPNQVTDGAAQVTYQKPGTDVWQTVSGKTQPMPHSRRLTHQVELTGLTPATIYHFRVGTGTVTYTFRTMPAHADRPIRFAVGGDTMHRRQLWERTNREVLKQDPEFVMFGGDLAYEDGSPAKANRVLDWLAGAKATLITPQKRVVPILVAIGNHEVAGSYGKSVKEAPYFYHLFSFPGVQGYNVLDFGNYMSVISLDTNHTNAVAGAQTEWLAKTLQARRHVPHVFPLYHVPAYPSVRDFNGSVSAQVRQHWSPLFERYGVRAVFENHDHAYKRTFPIRQGEKDLAHGVTYLGDGAWGVDVRKVHEDAWYLARALSVRHFILVTVQGPFQRFDVISENGHLIDRYRSLP